MHCRYSLVYPLGFGALTLAGVMIPLVLHLASASDKKDTGAASMH